MDDGPVRLLRDLPALVESASSSKISMKLARLASLALAATLFAGVAAAQPAPPPPPLPAESSTPAPAPPPFAGDPALEPQVTIIKRDNDTVEEVRIGGELRFVRVTPRNGRPYFLVPDPNGGQFIRRNSLDTSVKVPMWMILSW
jgi:hypothetical protein